MSGGGEDMDDTIVPGSALDNLAALFGPGFVRSRSRCWKAFEDIVYFANFGGVEVEGIDGSDGGMERGMKHFLPSSLDANDRICVEDPTEVVVKILHQGRMDWAGAVPGVLISDLEKCTTIFRQAVTEEDSTKWRSNFVARPDIQALLRNWNETRSTSAAFQRMKSHLPFSEPTPRSSPPAGTITAISNESFICLARQAGCLTLDRDCYDELRRISDSFIKMMVRTISSETVELRDVVNSEEVNCALNSLTGNVVFGYGFRG
jgi:hypothetical protein